MFVSDVQVLRRFTQKLAATGGGGDGEPEMAQPSDGPVNLNDQSPTAPAKAAPAKSEPTMIERALSSLQGAGGQAKALGQQALSHATPKNLGLAAAGAGLGGGALYGISRLLQSEEQRKKKTPVLAPALGAVAGGVALPALIAALYGNKAGAPGLSKNDMLYAGGLGSAGNHAPEGATSGGLPGAVVG